MRLTLVRARGMLRAAEVMEGGGERRGGEGGDGARHPRCDRLRPGDVGVALLRPGPATPCFAILFGTSFVADAFICLSLPISFAESLERQPQSRVRSGVRRDLERRGRKNRSSSFAALPASCWLCWPESRSPECSARSLSCAFTRTTGRTTPRSKICSWPLAAHVPVLFLRRRCCARLRGLNARGRFLVSALAPVLLHLLFLAGPRRRLWGRVQQTRAVLFTLGGLAGGLASWVANFRR